MGPQVDRQMDEMESWDSCSQNAKAGLTSKSGMESCKKEKVH